MLKTFIKYFFVWSLSVLVLAGGLVLIQKSGMFPQLFPETVKANPDCDVNDTLKIQGYAFDNSSWQDFNLTHSGYWTFGIHSGDQKASVLVDGAFGMEAWDCSSSMPTCTDYAWIVFCTGASTCDGNNGIDVCNPTTDSWECLSNLAG
jgi:hypothetical protein